MASEPDCSQLSGPFETNPNLLIYVLLRVFHVFIETISHENSGNPSIVLSILRDYSMVSGSGKLFRMNTPLSFVILQNWDGFYRTLSQFFELFKTRLDRLNDIKITQKNYTSENKFIVQIEYIYGQKDGYTEEDIKKLCIVPIADGSFSSKNLIKKSRKWNYFFEHKSSFTVIKSLNSTRLAEQCNNILFHCARLPLRWFPKKKVPAIEDGTSIKDQKSDDEEKSINIAEVRYDKENLCDHEDNNRSLSPFCDDFFTVSRTSDRPIRVIVDSSAEHILSMEKEFENPLLELTVRAQNERTKIELEIELNRLESNEHSEYKIEDDHNLEKENEEFEKKIDEQQRQHAEELQQKKEERAKKQREMESEMNEFRVLQKRKFTVLMNCIHLSHRFDEKEKEWSDWIEMCYRRLIGITINQFGTFQEEMGGSTKKFSTILRTDADFVLCEVGELNKKLTTTLDKLNRIFHKLDKIDNDFKDVQFIRILQKSVCDVASKLIDVLEQLSVNDYTVCWYEEVLQKFSRIEISDVPSVHKLRTICKDGYQINSENLNFPIWHPKSTVVIEEVSSDEEEEQLDSLELQNTFERATSETEDDQIPGTSYSRISLFEIRTIEKTQVSQRRRRSATTSKSSIDSPDHSLVKCQEDQSCRYSRNTGELRSTSLNQSTSEISKFESTKWSDRRGGLRSHIISLYEKLMNSDDLEGTIKFVGLEREPMRIKSLSCKNNCDYSDIVPIWNSIVKDQNHFLELSQFKELVNSKIDEFGEKVILPLSETPAGVL
ncbi:hypothetical protein CRE_05805 [Caenorhabditis remanei]|uniref:Uncharacterized protein n=1 Tax=Caenorhabditis remanei TaxID=31234 RepID=E3M077_CAERE|nr:hypothetical protein CRE_05805 [Caenorhabditis remanei]